jgi:hypothetical protein
MGKHILRVAVALVVAALCGAMFCGCFFWAGARFSGGSVGPLGPSSHWASSFAVVGSLAGGTLGAVVGVIIGIANPTPLWGGFIGAVIGCVVATVLLITGPQIDGGAIMIASLAVLVGFLTGFITPLLLRVFSLSRRQIP